MTKLVIIFALCSLFLDTLGNEETLFYAFNAKTSIMGPYNATAQQAARLDINSNISSLYNGKTGEAFVFSYETGIVVYIPGGSNETWDSSKQTYEDYFTNLPPQIELFETGEKIGVTLNESSITGEISEKIGEILASLSPEYSSACVALSSYLNVSKISSDILKSSLDGFSDVMGDVSGQVRGDFKWLVGMFQGMGDLFDDVKCGIGLLADEGVSLDLGKILTEPTGIHVLIYFLNELPPNFNVRRHLGNVLNNEVRFFTTIDQMGGGMAYGFDGFIHVLTEIVDYINGQGSIQSILTTLNKFYNNPETNVAAVREEWPKAVKDLQDALKARKLTDDLGGLTQLLTNIQNGTWKENGVNMSSVIKALLETDNEDDIDAIAEVVKLLGEYQPQE